MGSEVQPWETNNRPASSEVRVDYMTTRPDPLSSRRPPIRELHTIRATVVEPGTYDRLVAGDRAAKAAAAERRKRAASAHRVDLAEYLPALQRIPEQAIGLNSAANDVLAPANKSARLVTTGGKPAVRGIGAIVDWLRSEGIRLEVLDGRLDVKAKVLGSDVREVLDTFGDLIVGHLSGKPVPCALRHLRSAPAYTLTVPSLPVCRDHLEELDS
jgi:hypothetical protein